MNLIQDSSLDESSKDVNAFCLFVRMDGKVTVVAVCSSARESGRKFQKKSDASMRKKTRKVERGKGKVLFVGISLPADTFVCFLLVDLSR